MILGMSVGAFTILHVIITLVAIGSGLIVVGGMFASNSLPVTTALFLFTTALTCLTGFLFPIHGFTPALGVGIVACVILAVALFALYKEHLVGAWRWIYVITAVVSRRMTPAQIAEAQRLAREWKPTVRSRLDSPIAAEAPMRLTATQHRTRAKLLRQKAISAPEPHRGRMLSLAETLASYHS
jgi:hypothetical protein